MLKGNKSLNDWMESLGNKQYWVWTALTIIFLAELFGRSYIFNKEKVKAGGVWVTTLLSGQKFDELKEAKLSELQKDFEKLLVD